MHLIWLKWFRTFNIYLRGQSKVVAFLSDFCCCCCVYVFVWYEHSLWYSIFLAIKYVGGGWRKFNGNNKHDKNNKCEWKKNNTQKPMSMALCGRMMCASFGRRSKREWDAAWKKDFSMPKETACLKCIECCDLLCGVWLKWKSNPWTVLGIRSRQYCVIHSTVIRRLSTFLFFSIFTVTVKRNRINFGRQFTHKQMRQLPPQHSNYIKASLMRSIPLDFSCFRFLFLFFSFSNSQQPHTHTHPPWTEKICNTNTQQHNISAFEPCITDRKSNGNDIIYFILSHKYNSACLIHI